MTSRIEKNKKQRFNVAKKGHIEKSKSILKKLFVIVLIIAIITSIIYLTCRYIGTSGINIKEYGLQYDNLPDNFYGLKVIQISDINYNEKTTNMKNIKRLVKNINSLRPDIIVFTGDLIYGSITTNETKELENNLSKLEATLGKYAIFGEDNENSHIIINNAGFKDLSNSYDLIYKGDYSPILIVGFDTNNMSLESSFSYFKDNNEDIFTLAIMHKPDMIDEILDYHHIDLAMAGHSLNGLIKIPGIGPLFTYDGAHKYFDSYYRIDKTDLYISSGIGTRKYPYRLFNHPSINFYRLK